MQVKGNRMSCRMKFLTNSKHSLSGGFQLWLSTLYLMDRKVQAESQMIRSAERRYASEQFQNQSGVKLKSVKWPQSGCNTLFFLRCTYSGFSVSCSNVVPCMRESRKNSASKGFKHNRFQSVQEGLQKSAEDERDHQKCPYHVTHVSHIPSCRLFTCNMCYYFSTFFFMINFYLFYFFLHMVN